jgi:hypothetical protein
MGGRRSGGAGKGDPSCSGDNAGGHADVDSPPLARWPNRVAEEPFILATAIVPRLSTQNEERRTKNDERTTLNS